MAGFQFPPPPPPPPKATATDAPDQYSSQRGGFQNARGSRGRGFHGRGRGNSTRGGARGGYGNTQQQRGGYQGSPAPAQPYAPQTTTIPGLRTDTVAQVQPQQLNTSLPHNHKRKREPAPAPPPTSKPKPPRAKAVPPPAVPSFGFSLPPAPASQLPPPSRPKNDADKRRKLHLGLTSREDDDKDVEEVDPESGAEEDIDEEAAFAANADFEGMSFEYNGQQISLRTPAEISAWIKDRSKHFPTKQRIVEKAQEAAEKRASELEFLRRVQGKKESRQRPPSVAPASEKHVKASAQKSKADLGDLRARVEQSIAAKRQASDASSKPPPTPTLMKVDLGLGGYESDSASSSYNILDEESSVVSSSEDSDDPSDDCVSDGAPEEQSSRTAPTPIVVPPPLAPPPLPDQPKEKKDGVCDTWKKYGKCNRKGCRWKHPPKEEKHMSLFERLVEQENEKADRLALDAIKWLGRNGFLG